MSGAVAVHAAYNGSGTQGLAVTNKIQGNDGDVMSVFWNKNDATRQLLYGSAFVEIQSSGATSTSLFGSSRLFTVNNDIDCLGDLYLQFKLEDFTLTGYTVPAVTLGATPVTLTAVSPLIAEGSPNWLLSLIDRVEVQVGTQIWQTIEKHDIKAVLASELNESAFDAFYRNTSNSSGNVYLSLPSLFKTVGPQLSNYSNHTEDGYLMAAAPNQSVKIKVSFVPTPTFSYSGGLIKYTIVAGAGPNDIVTYKPANSGLAITYIGTSDANTLAAFNTATGLAVIDTAAVALGYVPIVSGTFSVTNGPAHPALSACKLYGKHQIMCNDERESIKAMRLGMPKRLNMTQNVSVSGITNSAITIDLDLFSLYASHLIITGYLGAGVFLLSAELKLNSSSFSGVLPGALLTSATAETMGLRSNGNMSDDGINFKYTPDGIGTHVFPLASTLFSGSSVPLNRFDSIRLALTFTPLNATTLSTDRFVSVTCVGETTALYKGGAATLAMY